MIYELETFFRSIRREGMGPSLRKIGIYASQIFRFLGFLASPRPETNSADEAVEYGWNRHGGLFRSGQIRSEITEMARAVAKLRPKVAVEIGTANGGTFFLWTQTAAPDAELISIDLPGGIHGGGYPFWRTFLYRRFARKDQTIHLLRASSYDPATAKSVAQILGGRKIDFLFIDGDHTLKGVRKDFEIYSPMVRPGGMIAFHDICRHAPEQDCHVDDYWAEIKGRYDHAEFVEDANQGWAGIGVVNLPK